MPIANVHLLHISPVIPPVQFLQTLLSAEPAPLTVSIPVRWIVTPNDLSKSSASALLKTPWSVLFITVGVGLPQFITNNLLAHYHVQVGIPSRLLEDYKTKNYAFLHPTPSSIPPLTGPQHIPIPAELAGGLLHWIEVIDSGCNENHGKTDWKTGPVSMLNFMAFKPGGEFKASYVKYGQSFASDIGKRRGGIAKLVGGVIRASAPDEGKSSSSKQGTNKEREEDRRASEDCQWDDFALAHYPSIRHFVNMVGSDDYQVVNQRDRLPALENTCVLFTSELLVEEILKGSSEARTNKL